MCFVELGLDELPYSPVLADSEVRYTQIASQQPWRIPVKLLENGGFQRDGVMLPDKERSLLTM